MLRLAVFLAALAMPIMVWAQTSQAHGPLDRNKTEQNSPADAQKNTPDDLSGAKQPPFRVEIVRSDADKEKERRDQERNTHQAAEEHQLVVATWALVVVTLALALFTGLLYWSTRRIAIDAQEAGAAAIKLARDEFNANHRPEIIIHSVELARDIDGEEGTGYGAHFTVVNTGRTDAIIRKIEGRTHVRHDLKAREDFSIMWQGERRLAPGEEWEGAAIFGDALNTAVIEVSRDFGNPAILWCIGRITYADSDERIRRMGFCLAYNKTNERWVRERDSEYEYSY